MLKILTRMVPRLPEMSPLIVKKHRLEMKRFFNPLSDLANQIDGAAQKLNTEGFPPYASDYSKSSWWPRETHTWR